MNKALKRLFGLLLALVVVLAFAAAAIAWWGWQRPVPMHDATVDYQVSTGNTPRQIAQRMQAAGISVSADAFVILARASGRDKQLKAGDYQAQRGDTLWRLLERMAAGDATQARLTFPEGWTFAQIRAALDADARVRHDTAGLNAQAILLRLNLDMPSPEGLFHPDTYVFSPGSSDLDILARAAQAQRRILDEAWAGRAPDLPLKTPYEALILASLVEKETGLAADRARVAAVFVNRLRLGMPLQTDPSVLYGLGEDHQGALRRRDLRQDTPWNTYTRPGLPPTPIASPGRAALHAALHPADDKALYFVSRGDGSSEFSANLAAHNRAVNKYIRNRNP